MSGIIVVFFTSPDCGACHAARRAIKHLVDSDREITAYEVDAVMNPALTNEFGFFHLPSLYLYINGHFHAEIQSQADPDALLGAITALSHQPAQEEP